MSPIRIDAELVIPGSGDPIEKGTVVIEGGAVGFVGAADEAPPSPGATRFQVAAAMPGLWECHAHFAGIWVPDMEALARESIVVLAARATTELKATLNGGVTSAREVGGLGIPLRRAIEEGAIEGPAIYAAGAVLSPTGGHGDVHGFPVDFVEQLSARGDWLGALCDGVPECLKAVRRQLRSGASVIKICASGGVMSELDHPIHQQFSDEELAAIVQEAARAERVVAAHCHGKPGIMAALRAGAKTIEHGSYLDQEAAELMIQTDAVLVPTRMIIDEGLAMKDTIPAYAYRKLVALADQHAEALQIAIAAGVTIAMGTDIFGNPALFGQNSREVRHLIDAGMTPLQAVEAATANGPSTLGPQAPRSGRLQSGYDADVIAFDTNPLTELDVWGEPDRITHIWKAGELVKQPA